MSLVARRVGLLASPLDSDADAVVAAMTGAAPSASHRLAIVRLIRRAKRNGYWDQLRIWHLFAAQDATAALVNWKTPSASATATATFAAWGGYTGNGSSTGVDSGQALASVTGTGLDNMSMGVWSLADASGAANDCGGTDANSVVNGRTGGGSLSNRANAAAADSTSVANSIGMYGWSRGNSANFIQWKAGLIGGTVSRVSSAIAAGNMMFCRGGTTFSARQIAMGWMGAFIPLVQLEQMAGDLRDYFAAVGVAA